MHLRSLILVIFAVFATACSSITMVEEQVYPAVLNAPFGPISVMNGTSSTLSASARIYGRNSFSASDSITVVVGDPSIVRVTNVMNFQAQCPPVDGLPVVCLDRTLLVHGLKMGETTITFKFGARADTVWLSVTQGKG